MLGVVHVAPGTFFAVIAASAIAASIATLAGGRGLVVPVVVIELLFGIVLGPQVIGLQVTQFIQFFADLGLGLLFFFAGYEIDMRRIMGLPLRLGLIGWLLSLALAYTIGGVLAASGIVLSLLYTGSALSTTAIGTLIPILSDAGEMRTRFGTYLLAAGAVGEFGPILLLTLILSTQSTAHNAVILVAFVALAVGVAIFAVRSSERTLPLFEQTIEASSQLVVRWILVLVFALALLAFELGLDLLLGGFAAGVITRQVLKARELPGFDSKLTAVAFGVFVPFFFVVSGMQLDIHALFASVAGVLKMLLFFVLFLVVRGTPALVLYRKVLDARARLALALMCSTQLPLVLAITALATSSGHMRPSTAAALVGAAVLSTLVFPFLALRLRGEEETTLDTLAANGEDWRVATASQEH
ncbi:MAG TPA: cation:proton antiporter [Solirubrobacteraceae bacterium]|jgi:Kef-type K+ transport system membrane component KefB|nr:cation:proton antiporter [Solirubrobacteraceae bacterium]